MCSQAGALPAAATVNVVAVPVGKGITCPSAVTHGRFMHAPEVPPQSVSVEHVPNRFEAEFVVHRFSPLTPCSR